MDIKTKLESNYFYVIAVKDELTNTFLQPSFGNNLDEIKRIFSTNINTIPLWRENASDYSLYLLGSFNQETGEFLSYIEKLVSGNSVKRKENN